MAAMPAHTGTLTVSFSFTDNWIGRVEYRYYDFGDKDLDGPGPGSLGSLDLNTDRKSVV